MALAGAYQLGRPSTVATFDYSYLVFVAFWDLFIFDLTPTVGGLVGMACIVAADIMITRSAR